MTRIFFALLVTVVLAACKGGSADVKMQNLADSAGYALGVNVATGLQQQKMASVNFGFCLQAIEEVIGGKTTAIPVEETGIILQQFSMQAQMGMGDTTNKGSMEGKVVDGKPVLTNMSDSAGYAFGVNIGTNLKMSGMSDLNLKLMKTAIGHVLNKDSLAIKADSALTVLRKYQEKSSTALVEKSKKEGAAFLEKNGKRPEVKTTASGLQYEVIKEGSGPKPTASDIFVAHYVGTLIDNTEFDGSIKRGQPLEMPVSQVIPGWIEGLQLMSVGSKYKFYIPYNLGYGEQGNPRIPGGSTLIFELELLDVKKP